LLPRYAWIQENSPGNHTRPTGLLKPNDFGLFDVLGNAMEWCHDAYGMYAAAEAGDAVNDDGDKEFVEDEHGPVLRGASFLFQASGARSAYRDFIQPGYLDFSVGVRPARTFR